MDLNPLGDDHVGTIQYYLFEDEPCRYHGYELGSPTGRHVDPKHECVFEQVSRFLCCTEHMLRI